MVKLGFSVESDTDAEDELDADEELEAEEEPAVEDELEGNDELAADDEPVAEDKPTVAKLPVEEEPLFEATAALDAIETVSVIVELCPELLDVDKFPEAGSTIWTMPTIVPVAVTIVFVEVPVTVASKTVVVS